ncbi:MAG: hypothetical protein A3F14_06155 [Gammaproteobacteria bacterium RIFCSPHIGHO2_12_FULL_43_28]|nr:MAG: hypothetical protein A3F14_06155 [Gammaproteobacteria bacterium RIFCSPHIGHO2_12_FULL_43_28]
MDFITLTREDHLAVLTFNRADKLNAFNYEMAAQFENLCQELNDDQTIRVILLQGAGEAFMTGTDLYEIYRNLESVTAEALGIIRQFNACIMLLREMEKMVIASVHGLIMGTGISLLLAADLVVASETAKFSMRFTQNAVSPVGAVSYLLPRIVGAKRAMELLSTSDVLDAFAAERLGLVNWVVPHAALETKSHEIAKQMVNGPTVALTQTKQLINSAWSNKLSSQLELEAESFMKCAYTKDFKTAVKAFVNKSVPEFEGK